MTGEDYLGIGVEITSDLLLRCKNLHGKLINRSPPMSCTQKPQYPKQSKMCEGPKRLSADSHQCCYNWNKRPRKYHAAALIFNNNNKIKCWSLMFQAFFWAKKTFPNECSCVHVLLLQVWDDWCCQKQNPSKGCLRDDGCHDRSLYDYGVSGQKGKNNEWVLHETFFFFFSFQRQ